MGPCLIGGTAQIAAVVVAKGEWNVHRSHGLRTKASGFAYPMLGTNVANDVNAFPFDRTGQILGYPRHRLRSIYQRGKTGNPNRRSSSVLPVKELRSRGGRRWIDGWSQICQV